MRRSEQHPWHHQNIVGGEKYARLLSARLKPFLDDVFEKDGIPEAVRQQIREILNGASGEISVSIAIVEAFSKADVLLVNTVTEKHLQGENDGWKHIVGTSSSSRRVTGYKVDIPELVDKIDRKNQVLLVSNYHDNNERNFASWRLQR